MFNEGINNIENTKWGTDGQTWRRLKQIVAFKIWKTWDGLFTFLVRDSVQIFRQIIAIRVKTLTNTNLVSRDIKWEKALQYIR